MREEAKNWWEQAQSDLHTSEVNLKEGIYYASAFFSQQAAEKALKAVQIEKLGKFFKVHDLLTLAESVNAPKNIVMRCLRINPYYTITRYPDVGNNTDKEAAQELLNGAREVLEWAKQTLKQ